MFVKDQEKMETQKKEYTVTEISGLLKRTVEEKFSLIRVRGEISGFKLAPSGHAYFSLKDQNSVLSSVCWRNTYMSLPIKPEEGKEVVCLGTLTTYAGQSKYQLMVQSLEQAGVGELMEKFERLKKQLASEGLFSADRKKKIPYLPSKIGIITSPTGAVIKDILHRLEDRFPVQVIVWPVLVQGENSKEQVAKAIEGLNNLEDKPDLIIVARGGGSIEDLWSFNEELVVRAAAKSELPIISAVGHETDFTLLDFVADLRAPTPTASAEMAVPVRSELIATVKDLERRMYLSSTKFLSDRRNYLNALSKAIPNFRTIFVNLEQRLDDCSIRFILAAKRVVEQKYTLLLDKVAQIKDPSNLITAKSQYLTILSNKLNSSTDKFISDKAHSLEVSSSLFNSYDYKNTLKRGFALIRDSQGRLITKISSIRSKDPLEIEFKDGKKKVEPVI